jgi:hypothetical protein
MRRLLAVLALLSAATLARAGDEDKANTLTAREIADGWLLLFDGATTFGWDVEGEAAIDKGVLTVGGKKTSTLRLNTQFSDFELRLECRCEGDEDAKLVTRRGPTVNAHSLRRSRPMINPKWDTLRLRITFDDPNGTETDELEYNTAAGDKIKGAGTTSGGSGPASIRLEVPRGTKLSLRNVKLRPLGARSLFNGKDLTGWKVFEGKKSKFAVADGAINVKNGPGDLQTEGKWADFVLQLECISHGKHLNSGIFFRCRAGEYQNGYEAQVRNEFTAEPKQTYLVEEYDPKTHELKGKKKVTSTAVDYGTGGIYRRVPARLGVARDGEWFTMTVVARGNHFATWVNGVQVVDWTDNRPPSENARSGCCLNAGHISFQGHDPTTNLSFRNVRLAELPRVDE